jgi:hypothetical protein
MLVLTLGALAAATVRSEHLLQAPRLVVDLAAIAVRYMYQWCAAGGAIGGSMFRERMLLQQSCRGVASHHLQAVWMLTPQLLRLLSIQMMLIIGFGRRRRHGAAAVAHARYEWADLQRPGGRFEWLPLACEVVVAARHPLVVGGWVRGRRRLGALLILCRTRVHSAVVQRPGFDQQTAWICSIWCSQRSC